jgi:probable phosphoglycerate mutase
MRGQERVGILQLDLRRDADQKVGGIPFFYLTPETRTQGLGVQLLGQAVSTYRPLGREFLRLRCAPENGRARRFYERYGFQKIGQEPGGLGELDVLEKFIGYGLN